MNDQSVFGPYRLVRILGSGGMSVIYLAREVLACGVERQVVLKRLSPEDRGDEQFETMFFDEVRVLSGLSHPGLPTILAAGTIGDEPYFAMEYIDGVSLSEIIKEARGRGETLPRREALSIACALAQTLAYVHEHRDEFGRRTNIVHRDVKPANALVSTSGAVKLIDFGIAQAANRVYQTATGVVKGTLGYMAPEQLAETEPLTHLTDVFCFGVLLYELLVGEPPFAAPDPLSIYKLIANGNYRPPRSVRQDISAAMDALIAACLSTAPAARPQSMWSVAGALRDELTAHGGAPTGRELAALVGRVRATIEAAEPLASIRLRAAPGQQDTEVDLQRPVLDEPGRRKR